VRDFPPFDLVQRDPGASQILEPMLDFVLLFFGQPRAPNRFNVSVAELLQAQQKEIVVHRRKLTSKNNFVVRLLRLMSNHRSRSVQRLLRQQIAIQQRSHLLETVRGAHV
jgi:hypothetical protein